VIISADGHCGLPLADYRRYLDSRFHPAFDDWLAQKEAERAAKLATNFEYIMGWESSNEEGLRGAYDGAVRDKELDQDGVSADVLFADADAITGMGSPPFNAGLAAGEITNPSWPSPGPGPTTAFWPTSAPPARSAGPGSPSSRCAMTPSAPSRKPAGRPTKRASAAS